MMSNGRFRKGEHRSPATEFKPGQHWREPQPFWQKEWLYREYIERQRSCQEIAAQFGCRLTNIQYWLKKHGIKARSLRESRAVKKWGASGKANGMYGKRGELSPQWRGGLTPGRQALYAKCEWNDIINAVWDRDKGVCRRCGTINFNRRRMHAHHIIPFQQEDGRTDIEKIVLLCAKCHRWVHSKHNTDSEWLERG